MNIAMHESAKKKKNGKENINRRIVAYRAE